MECKNRKIHVVGINSFDFDELSLSIKIILKGIKNIAIPESYFDQICSWFNDSEKDKKNLYSSKSNSDLINWLDNNKSDVVLISRGDPLWFGIGRILLEHFSQEELFFYPSITCVQLAFRKLKIPWQGVNCISIHGRETDKLIKALKSRVDYLAIIPDPQKNNIELIRKNLAELQIYDLYEIWICEQLGFKNEKVKELKTNEKIPNDISDLHIVVLLKKEHTKHKYNFPLFGINDSAFKTFNDRPNLLTKKEIRVQILADLELPENGVIWDIGAGCGSIGLEALRLRPKLKLISIDKRFGTKDIILENAKRLRVSPFQVVENDINKFLGLELNLSLERPSRIIIGGCSLETKVLVIKKISEFIKKGDIFVLPLVTLKSLYKINSLFEKLKFETNLTLIHIEKGVSIADGTRFEASNPIFILKGKV